jgi:nucleotide-binding universal stress UspA family protein
MLQTAVQRVIGDDVEARYIVRRGPLVEETILDEVTAGEADVVVVGRGRSGIIGRLIRLLFDEPDVETYLRNRHGGEVLAVPKA